MKDSSMTLVDHITELRKRVIAVLIIFVITMIGGLFAADYLLTYLRQVPTFAGIEWHAFSPLDGLRLYMQIAVIISMVVTLPFALFQVWLFVKPGLRPEEQSATLRYIPMTVLLFVIGFSFGYFVVFRMAFLFTTKLNASLGLTTTYGVTQYFSFLLNIVLALSIVFELPVVVMFLTKLRILNPMLLKKMRKVAYLGLLILASMITPPDIFSHLSVAIPLVVLYEISLHLSSFIYRKQLEADRMREQSYADDEHSGEQTT